MIWMLKDISKGIPIAPIVENLLAATLLCNTDAFEFEGDPTNLRFVGDDRFSTLQELIDAWSEWAKGRYG